MKTWQMENSKTSKISESQKYHSEFFISEFSSFSYSQNRKPINKKTWKKFSQISEISEVSEFSTWPPFPINCSLVTYLTHLDTVQMRTPLSYANVTLYQPCSTLAYVFLHRFLVHILFTRHLPRGHSISCLTNDSKRTVKLFTGLIELRHMTTSWEVIWR